MERNVEIDKISDGKRYGANDLVKVGCDDCRGCSACCHGMGDSIVLDPMDVYRLEKKLGKTMEEILLAGNVALRVVDGVILPHLKMTEQSDRCSFLNEEGRCSIHDARPGFCRMFPLGRLYEDGTFSYFLQVNECPKENKTKVKVRRWLDTPELGKYEAFTTKWHYYLKEKQNAARESEDDAFRQQISMNILKLFYLLPYDGNTDFYTEAVARSENTTKSIFCGNFSSCGSPPVFLYRFVGKLSCSGVDQEGFPGLTPPPAAAENDLPIFQQNFASYLYKGNVGKVDQQTFSAVEKTITWCKADRQVGKCAAGCKISLNGVENQSVLAGFNVNQVVERQPVFLGNTL